MSNPESEKNRYRSTKLILENQKIMMTALSILLRGEITGTTFTRSDLTTQISRTQEHLKLWSE